MVYVSDKRPLMYVITVPRSIQSETRLGMCFSPSRKNPKKGSTLSCFKRAHMRTSFARFLKKFTLALNGDRRIVTSTMAKESSSNRKTRMRLIATFFLCAFDHARNTSHVPVNLYGVSSLSRRISSWRLLLAVKELKAMNTCSMVGVRCSSQNVSVNGSAITRKASFVVEVAKIACASWSKVCNVAIAYDQDFPG